MRRDHADAWLRSFTLAALVAGAAAAQAQEPLPAAVPVPRLAAIPEPYDQAALVWDERQIARYHFGQGLRRPFVYPVIGPSGRGLTRMGHPHDPVGHSHHNSVWISHHDVNGIDFWSDRGAGRIVHRRILRYEDGDQSVWVAAENAWLDDAGKPLLTERRRLTVLPGQERQWLLVIDLELTAVGQPVTLGKTPFGLCAVRMAKTIGVRDGGGTIRNSAGGVNEAGVFWKQARWVDYSGPVAAGVAEGITLLDHPANPNHPSYFHVRDDGWMGAALTYDAPRVIDPGRPLVLRYGLWIHAGVPAPEAIERQYEAFAKLAVAEFTGAR